MRFLLLTAAILAPATSTAAADEPNVIMPKTAVDPSSATGDPLLEHVRRQGADIIQPRALGRTRSDCPEVATYQTARPGEPLRLRRLDELPHANAYAAVYRKIGGCEVPMLVGYDIGKR